VALSEEFLAKLKEESPEAYTEITALQATAGEAATYKSKFQSAETAKKGVLADLDKMKVLRDAAKEAGLDLTQEDFRDQFTALLAGKKGEGAATPQEEIEKALKPLKRQIEALSTELTTEREEKKKALQTSREQKIESALVQELKDLDCKRINHVIKLVKDDYTEDEEGRVVTKSEFNPLPVKQAIKALLDDEDYQIYFPASGASGSGLDPANSSVHGAGIDNPFAKKTANATVASQIFQADRPRAERLYAQARAAGEADPALAVLFR
jgi:uncharacterized protein YihD (DUF1040 family)